MAERWTAADIPDQTGRTAVVTGGNSGLGLAAAEALAATGAAVVIACRNLEKGEAAADRIRSATPGASVEVTALDLADLASVRDCAERLRARPEGIDLLLNNAGVMATPRRLTADGFELQFATNHLGHFALTGLVLPALRGRPGARVVSVASNAHKAGRIAWDNLDGSRRYFRWNAYGQSKLANLLFAFELDRRLRAVGWDVQSVAAHPGYSATNLSVAGPPLLDRLFLFPLDRLAAQSSEKGALPELYAATRPYVEGGSYVGPDGPGEWRGYPHLVQPAGRARDEAAAARLWEVSEEMTGVAYDELAEPAGRGA